MGGGYFPTQCLTHTLTILHGSVHIYMRILLKRGQTLSAKIQVLGRGVAKSRSKGGGTSKVGKAYR